MANNLLKPAGTLGRGVGGDIFPKKKPEEQMAIQSSFGKMIGGTAGGSAAGGMGGGLPSMAELEASSMRLAGAAAKRDAEKFSIERGANVRDQQRAEMQSSISRYEQELNSVKNTTPRNPAEQTIKNQRISEIENKISNAKSEMRNLDAAERLAVANIRSMMF